MKVFIIGVKKAKTKNGRDFCQYYFQKAFTAYETENSDCLGMVVGTEFSYKDYSRATNATSCMNRGSREKQPFRMLSC